MIERELFYIRKEGMKSTTSCREVENNKLCSFLYRYETSGLTTSVLVVKTGVSNCNVVRGNIPT